MSPAQTEAMRVYANMDEVSASIVRAIWSDLVADGRDKAEALRIAVYRVRQMQ